MAHEWDCHSSIHAGANHSRLTDLAEAAHSFVLTEIMG